MAPLPDVRPAARTFAEVLSSSMVPPAVPGFVHAPALTDKGEPAVFFSQEEISASLGPFAFSLVARTPQGRPAFLDIRAHLYGRCRFKDDFMISALDKRHLLLRFRNYEDYLSLLLKESLFVHGRLFRFFKWSMDFSPSTDSPILPVWISFPGLPVNFYLEHLLRSIAGNVGKVLKIDPSTLNLSQTTAARVCVELDISKPLPSRVWIGCPGGGAWQEVIYPNLPAYCSVCSRIGHNAAACKGLRNSPAPVKPAQFISDNKGKAIWQPVPNQKVPSEDKTIANHDPIADDHLLPNDPVINQAIDLTVGECSNQNLEVSVPGLINNVLVSGATVSSSSQPSVELIEVPVLAELVSDPCDNQILGESAGVPISADLASDPCVTVRPGNTQVELACPPLELPSNQKTDGVLLQSAASVALAEEIFSKRLEIAKQAELQNVLTLNQERPGVITRSMLRTGSTGNIPDSKQLL